MARLTREEARAETRRRVLDAASRVFTERGFHGASVEEIADLAGFTRGAVYSNFADKADLFLAVLDERGRRRIDQVAALLHDHPSPEEFFAAVRRTNTRRADEIRDWTILGVEFWLYAMRNPDVRPRLVEHDRATRAALARGIEAVLDAIGATSPAPLEELAVIVQALDDGITMQQLLDPGAGDDRVLFDAYQLLLRAARPRRR